MKSMLRALTMLTHPEMEKYSDMLQCISNIVYFASKYASVELEHKNNIVRYVVAGELKRSYENNLKKIEDICDIHENERGTIPQLQYELVVRPICKMKIFTGPDIKETIHDLYEDAVDYIYDYEHPDDEDVWDDEYDEGDEENE